MGIQIIGNGGVVAEVESNTRAMRVTSREEDVGAFGRYGMNVITGTMAAGLAANAEVLQFRWTDATRLALIRLIRFDGAGGIAAFAAGFWKFEAMIARTWTAAGTGGATATLTTNNGKLRTSFGTTLLAELRYSTTAALTAGTKTLDAQGIGAVVGGITATAGAW